MTDHVAGPVTAGLSRVAQMDRRERARVVRQLCEQYPAFRTLVTQVTIARGVAFGSGVALALALSLLAQDVSVWLVVILVLAGFGGFGYVAVVLSDSRFDLLLAVLGAHRTDELHGRLITEQVYGDDPDVPEPWEPSDLPAPRAAPRRFSPLPVESQLVRGRHA